MNKTIIINMNGIIFHIEEDAYDQLKNYMSGIKKHFAYTADSDEIVTDIENRIAEMFTEILGSEKKQVIATKDIEGVIAQMGSVADFETAEEDAPVIDPQPLRAEKRLYRDGEDRLLGGVCAGIGHYFNIESKWIRLFFVVAVLFFGMGIWIYLILWIVMPMAKTRSEKMSMKGEKLNLQNFKRNFDEELEALKSNHVINRAGGFLGDLLRHFVTFAGILAKIALKVICVLIILGGLAALVSVCVTMLILVGNKNLESHEVFNGIAMVNPEYRSALYFSAFVVTLIPLAALMLFAIRILFNQKIITRTGIFAMLVIWLTGLGVGIFYGARVAAEFSEDASTSRTTGLAPRNYFVLKLTDSRMFSHTDSLKYNIRPGMENTVDGELGGMGVPLDIYIEEARDGQSPGIVQTFSASGRDFDDALANANKIIYPLTVKDSLMEFGRRGQIGKKDLFRDQRIKLIIRIKKNTVLRIDRRLNDYIRGYDIDLCLPFDSENEPSADWVMKDSEMICAIDSLNRPYGETADEELEPERDGEAQSLRMEAEDERRQSRIESEKERRKLRYERQRDIQRRRSREAERAGYR